MYKCMKSLGIEDYNLFGNRHLRSIIYREFDHGTVNKATKLLATIL